MVTEIGQGRKGSQSYISSSCIPCLRQNPIQDTGNRARPKTFGIKSVAGELRIIVIGISLTDREFSTNSVNTVT